MKIEPNTFICADNTEVLSDIPNGFCDLCLTDPPYGIGADKAAREAALQRIAANGKTKAGRGWKLYDETDWDAALPSANTFEEIRRVSKHQIVWGGNYFTEHLPPSMGWFFWDKGQRNFSLADGELAWTSFNRALRVFNYSRAAALQEGKCHPTQKPVPLFVWCLMSSTKPGDLVIDPFCGVGTTALACHKTGRRFICIDREQKYIDIAQQRYRDLVAQTSLFEDGALDTAEGRGTACNSASTQIALDLE